MIFLSAVALSGIAFSGITPLAPVPLDPVQGETITLTPSDDVWVYPHSSNPGRDEAIRVWGAGGRAVAADPVDAEEFSYGYLRFTLPAHIKSARIVGATLELTNVVNDDMDADEVAGSPLEVRPLIGTFEEKSWSHPQIAKVYPDPKTVWGKGGPKLAKGQPMAFSIDLMAPDKDGKPSEEFRRALTAAFPANAGAEGQIGIALTSPVDVALVGMRRIYKIYTKDAENKERRPRLVLKLGPAS